MRKDTARGIRIKNEILDKVQQRAKRRGLTFNGWINWAVSLGLRSHKKK